MVVFARTFILFSLLLGCISSARAERVTTNDAVVKYCKEHLGEKVGEGECSHLAEAALKSARAKPWTAFKEYPNSGDYVWGQPVYALEMKDDSLKETKVPKRSIQPGDVMQLRDVKFEGKNLRGGENYNLTSPHHTAIVLAVKENNVIKVLEQNYNGKKVVAEGEYRLTDLKRGWLRIYRPVPEYPQRSRKRN